MRLSSVTAKSNASPSPKRASAQKFRPPSLIAGGKYRIDKRLGVGCFGEVWHAHDVCTKQQVAVKFESCQARHLCLEMEVSVLAMLAQPREPQGFAHCFYWGFEGQYMCLVMDLLSKSLEAHLEESNGVFTVQTVVLIADQVLWRAEYLHSKGIIHRDIKPENFMFGIKDKIHHLYLIDFGLSKRYWDGGKHSQMKTRGQLTGTARYASINAHRGVEQSRRDDLEAIGHMLMYFLRGQLPWSGLEAKTQEEKYRKIREKKEQTALDDLCQGYPDAFKKFLHAARSLDFKERPDYVTLRGHFRGVRAGHPGKLEDHDFQWLEGKELGKLAPLAPWETCRQPDDAELVKSRGGFFACLCGGKPTVQD